MAMKLNEKEQQALRVISRKEYNNLYNSGNPFIKNVLREGVTV
jgi:hypothetical protein